MIPRQTLTVRRPTGGGRVNGRWQPSGTETVFEFMASVQPLEPKEMETLPEGRRGKGGAYNLIGDNSPVLYTVKDNENPDIVEIYSEDYEILSSSHWKNGLIDNSVYIAVKVTTK